MEISGIPGMDPAHADAFAEAGLTSATELAVAMDLHALAQRTGVERETIEAYQAGARAQLESRLESAGVRGVEDLARADLDRLSATSGIPRAHLEAFQGAARARLGEIIVDEPPAAEPAAAAPPRPALPDRVILSEGRATARVVLEGRERAGLSIVTLRMDEDEAHVLERAPGDAVLLRERAATAPARVDGVLHRDLPIYKARDAADGSGAEEIRVRVSAIKDRRPAPADPAQAPAASAATAGAETAPGEPPTGRRKGFSLFRRK